jgi:hypothetical protein
VQRAASRRLAALLAAVLALPLVLAAALTMGAAGAGASEPGLPSHSADPSHGSTSAEAAHHPDDAGELAEPHCPDKAPAPSCHSADESHPSAPTAAARPDSDTLWGTQRFDGDADGLRANGMAARAPDLVALSISRT